MKKEREKLAVPLPEAIDGERWDIQRSLDTRNAGIGMRPDGKKFMMVSMGEDEVSRLVRLHEMVHAKISPQGETWFEQCDGLNQELMNLCEDARVHGQMNRLDFDTKKMDGIISDHEMGLMATESHPATLAALGAALRNTNEWNRLYIKIDDAERSEIFNFGSELALHRMHLPSSLPEFSETVQMVREITELFGDPSEPPQPCPIPTRELQQLAGPHELEDGDTWGEMTLEEPPLPLTLPGKIKGRSRKIPNVRGRRLHRVGRLFQDGRVFADRPPTKGGGAVLIDTSGSMSLTNEEVLALCETYPAGVIGAYSGEEYTGTLRVIGRKGRRVPDDQISPPGGGNVVDGPALEWLAKQPGPRFWISDAGVEGGPTGLRYCLKVCRAANITRVDDAWQIVGKER